MSQQIKGSSSTLGVSMDLLVERGISKKKSSKASYLDADSIRKHKRSSKQELTSSSTISRASAQKSHSEKEKISVSVETKKRSSKLEGQSEKEPKKRRHIEKPVNIPIKTANAKCSENTKENLSERDSTTKKASQKTMLKWLELGLESPSDNKPSTSQIRSPKRHKSSQDDMLSVMPKSDKRSRPKKTSKETVSSKTGFTANKENSLKSSQNMMFQWLSPSKATPGTSMDISCEKVLKSSEMINLDDEKLSPEKRLHDKQKRRKRKRARKRSQETAKSEENLSEKSSQAVLSGWLGSTPTKKESSKSIDVKHKSKSRKDKEKDLTKPKKTMSLKTLENLSQTKLRNITMQDIFGPDKSMQEVPTVNHCLFKTIAKENISKPRKKRKKAPLDIDDLPTFQANLPEQSASFKKYGVAIPSVEEILADRKDLLVYKALVNKAKVIPLLPNPFENILEQPVKPPVKLLDCKHLSLEVIEEQFNKNKTILANIKNGTQYSEKHQTLQRINSTLPYNPSNMVFAYKQINCMANLIREEFDPKEKHLRYTFAVLIPELCLLIFMDTHKMTKEETIKYLEERPID